MDLIFTVGCEKRGIECGVDLPCLWKAELVRDRGEDLDDREGSLMLGGELWVGDGMFEVSSFQPDLVSLGEGGESLVVI